MLKATLTPEQEAAIVQLHDACTAAMRAGLIVFLAGRVEQSDGGTHFTTGVFIPDAIEKELSMFDHCFADAIRDLSVEWSNHRHASKLVWKDTPKEPPSGWESITA